MKRVGCHGFLVFEAAGQFATPRSQEVIVRFAAIMGEQLMRYLSTRLLLLLAAAGDGRPPYTAVCIKAHTETDAEAYGWVLANTR